MLPVKGSFYSGNVSDSGQYPQVFFCPNALWRVSEDNEAPAVWVRQIKWASSEVTAFLEKYLFVLQSLQLSLCAGKHKEIICFVSSVARESDENYSDINICIYMRFFFIPKDIVIREIWLIPCVVLPQFRNSLSENYCEGTYFFLYHTTRCWISLNVLKYWKLSSAESNLKSLSDLFVYFS